MRERSRNFLCRWFYIYNWESLISLIFHFSGSFAYLGVGDEILSTRDILENYPVLSFGEYDIYILFDFDLDWFLEFSYSIS